MRTYYTYGARLALVKLGFLEGVDPEDLPEFLAKAKRQQLQQLYRTNAAMGFPAGGLIENTEYSRFF
jgi:hypothetical protein